MSKITWFWLSLSLSGKSSSGVNKFFADFYLNNKLGSGYVVGNFEERKKLNSQGKGFIMSIVQLMPNSVSLSRNEYFFAHLMKLEN